MVIYFNEVNYKSTNIVHSSVEIIIVENGTKNDEGNEEAGFLMVLCGTKNLLA